MLKWTARTPEGRVLHVFGLSEGNVAMLEQARPIHVNGRDLGIGYDIAIVYAATEEILAEQMLKAGITGDPKRVDIEGELAALEDARTRGGKKGELSRDAMMDAMRSAHASLEGAGYENPGMVLVVDLPEARSLASTIANPLELLDVVARFNQGRRRE